MHTQGRANMLTHTHAHMHLHLCARTPSTQDTQTGHMHSHTLAHVCTHTQHTGCPVQTCGLTRICTRLTHNPGHPLLEPGACPSPPCSLSAAVRAGTPRGCCRSSAQTGQREPLPSAQVTEPSLCGSSCR